MINLKIIDEKGRLFGKINIIDLAMIIILITGLVLSVKFIAKQSEPTVYDTKYITIMFTENKPYPLLSSLKVGDKELDKQNNILAEIINISSKQMERVFVDNGDVKISPDPMVKEITIDMAVTAIEKDGKVYFKEKPLLIGILIEIETKNSYFLGEVIKIDD